MSEETIVEDVQPEVENVEEFTEEAETQVEAASDESDHVEASSEEGVQAETVEELQEEVEQAIEDGATEEEVQNMIKQFKLKVNGKEITKELDLSDEDAVRRELQLAAAGRSAMQEAAELKKLYAQEIERLKNDPWSVLQELELDPDELAEARLRERVEEMKKSPEQIEREQMQRELEEARRELERQRQEAEQARMSQLEEQAAVALEREIEEALDSHTTLPKSPKTVMRIADAMMWAMNNGFEDVSAKDVIPTVEDEIRREMRGFLDELPEQLFEEYVGKKNMERHRQKRLASMKKQPVKKKIEPTLDSVEKPNEKPKKKIKAKDYFRNL